MQFFKKKDKRYNSQLDNYTDKYKGTFILGLVMVVIGLVAYGIYLLIQLI
jgi:hypothetical protein